LQDLFTYQNVLLQLPLEYPSLNKCVEWIKWIGTLLNNPVPQTFASLRHYFESIDTQTQEVHAQMKKQLQMDIAQAVKDISSIEQAMQTPQEEAHIQETRLDVMKAITTPSDLQQLESAAGAQLKLLQEEALELEVPQYIILLTP
jgi:hypothetical protein